MLKIKEIIFRQIEKANWKAFKLIENFPPIFCFFTLLLSFAHFIIIVHNIDWIGNQSIHFNSTRYHAPINTSFTITTWHYLSIDLLSDLCNFPLPSENINFYCNLITKYVQNWIEDIRKNCWGDQNLNDKQQISAIIADNDKMKHKMINY